MGVAPCPNRLRKCPSSCGSSQGPPKPRPGLGEALLWCLAFWSVLILSALVTLGAVMGAFAARTDNPGKFAMDQLAAPVASMKPAAPDQPPRPPVPFEIGTALAYSMFVAQLASFAFGCSSFGGASAATGSGNSASAPPPRCTCLLVILVAPAFIVLSEGFQELFIRYTGFAPNSTEAVIKGTFQQVPWAVALISAAIGPGLVEELWCRGFLGRGLARYGFGWGIALTSFLFSALHLDPSQFVVFTLMGADLHFVYLASRSIWVPMLLHLFNNGIVTTLVLQPDRTRGGTGSVRTRRGCGG